MNTVDILKRAKARIENPEHWCVHEEARNKHGLMVRADAPGACQWCATGAIFAEVPASAEPKYVECLDAAALHIVGKSGMPYAAWVNDHTDHDTVMRMYDLAIAKAEENEEVEPDYPIPTALYPCMFESCRDEHSWPAEDLQWTVFGDGEAGWLCTICSAECYDVADSPEWAADAETIVKTGPLLSEVLEARNR